MDVIDAVNDLLHLKELANTMVPEHQTPPGIGRTGYYTRRLVALLIIIPNNGPVIVLVRVKP